MNIIQNIKRWIGMLLSSKIETDLKIKPIESPQVDKFIRKCARIYQGNPEWISNNVRTVNFAKTICGETARLTTLALGIRISGSARAEWLQQEVDKIYYKLRDWVEYACAFGTVIAKPDGTTTKVYTPDNFRITQNENDKITGIVFLSQKYRDINKKWYSRMEYHRIVDGRYLIDNICYIGSTNHSMDKQISIDESPWKGMAEQAEIENEDKLHIAVLKIPGSNNIDIDNPLGLPIFSDAIEELKDLDIAYSRNAGEIEDSERITLIDDRLISAPGAKVKNKNIGDLPRYARKVSGTGADEFYQEINPSLNTDVRLTGINALLSQIGYKCGFSNGYFVFNEKTGIQTATGIEADQQRTIQFIKDIRDQLQNFMDDLIYALNAYANMDSLAPIGVYDVTYKFGDITYNFDEDRSRWWSYVISGAIPKWYYFVKFEGLTEEEAKALNSEAVPQGLSDTYNNPDEEEEEESEEKDEEEEENKE